MLDIKLSISSQDQWSHLILVSLMIETDILLMEEILHQLICSLSQYLQGFIHTRWCNISAIISISWSFGRDNFIKTNCNCLGSMSYFDAWTILWEKLTDWKQKNSLLTPENWYTPEKNWTWNLKMMGFQVRFISKSPGFSPPCSGAQPFVFGASGCGFCWGQVDAAGVCQLNGLLVYPLEK